MLLIRLTAQDMRIIEGARENMPGEFAGAIALVRDRIAQAKVLKELGKTVTVRQESFAWKDALKVAKEILGDEVRMPPFPDYRWYQRINGALRRAGTDEERMKQLAEYAKEHLRKPISLDFLVCQQDRIMAGEFDGQMTPKGADTRTPINQLHKIMGPELPEE